MPFDIRKEADGYHVYDMKGNDRGKSKTRAIAERHIEHMVQGETHSKTVPGMLDGGQIGGVPTYLDDTYTRRQVERAYIDGRPVAVTAPSPTIDVAPATASEPATSAAPAPAIPAFKKGGILSRIAKKTTKGGLHKSLGIPQGQNIPEERIAAAATKPGLVGKQARLAQVYAKHRPGK